MGYGSNILNGTKIDDEENLMNILREKVSSQIMSAHPDMINI